NLVYHFHETFSVEWQIQFRSRAEANHSEPVASFQRISNFRPCHNAPRNSACDLAHDNRDARILKSPRHRFVLLGTLRTARVEIESFSVFAINDATIDWRAIRMHIED